jgi:hypothetical protein
MFGFFYKNKEKNFKLDQEELKPLSELNDNTTFSQTGLPISNDDLGGNSLNSSMNSNENSPIEPTFNPGNNNSIQNFGNGFSNLNNNDNNDLLYTKIENLQASQNLLKVKVETIENKLDLILKILENEISEQTKEKLNLDSMKNSLNSKLHNNSNNNFY